MSRVIAIDYGLSRTGIAISDETKTLARGLKVVANEGELRRELRVLVEMYKIDRIVVGIAKRSDGSLGEVGVKAVEVAEHLRQEFGDIIEFFEEAMTTRDVQDKMRELNIPIKKYKSEIDKYAAEIILQEYLRKS